MANKLLTFMLFLLLVLTSFVAAPRAADVGAGFSFALDDRLNTIACLTLKIPAGHHVYAHNPGDAGRPANLSFSLADGDPEAVYYPEGSLQRDYYDSQASVNVYEGTRHFYLVLPPQSGGKSYRATLSLLVCSPRNCTPIDKKLSGLVPANPQPLDSAPWKDDWLDLSARVTPQVGTSAPGLGLGMATGPAGPMSGLVQTRDPLADPLNLPQVDPVADTPADPLAGLQPDSLPSANLSVPVGEDPLESGPLPPPAGFDFQLTPVYADTSIEIYGLGKALLLGILAGLLLNAMPCVLPVLIIKMTGLLMTGTHDKGNLRRFREYNVFFAAGVLTLFTVLALVLGAMDLMWGQLYQSREFLLILLLVVFLMGLSMLGVFTLPVLDFKSLSRTKAHPRLQAYLTGLLSTFLATPCSGPLLGGVLGWAFTQPLPVLVVVFWAVGVGMALPYLVFCLYPKAVRILPHPGPWMQTFEHVVGFVLLGTALYLLSILPEEKYIPILTALLLVALGAFLWGQFCNENASRLRRRIGGCIFVAILVAASVIALRMEQTSPAWETFNAEHFTAQLGTRPMVVEFTADWCPNCKFVEATVFTEQRLKDMEAQYKADFIRVDLTNANACGTKLLEMLGSRSIPLTALFPAGDGALRPLVLRDVFTATSFEEAARRAFGR